MEKKKALEAQQCQAEESSENVQQQQQLSDVEKTKCEDDQSDKSLSRGSSLIVHLHFFPICCFVSLSLFCSLVILDPPVGHTMDILSPFISVLCHSD